VQSCPPGPPEGGRVSHLFSKLLYRVLVYLEPFLSTAVTALEISCTLVQPNHDRSLLMCPLCPDRLDLATGSHLSNKIRRCATITHHFLVGDGHGGVVIRPLTLDRLRRGCWGEAGVTSRLKLDLKRLCTLTPMNWDSVKLTRGRSHHQ
jgi:hypothetical protein